MQQTRRTFLQTTAALPLLIKTVSAETGPHLRFPTEPRQRLAVTSYPFRAYIESPTNAGRDKKLAGMDLTEFPAMMIKHFGIYNINPLGDHLSSTEPDYLQKFRSAVEAAGSHLVDLGLGGRDFSSSDAAIREEAVGYGRKWIDIAAVLGSPSVRQHLKTAKGTAPSVGNSAESLGQLAAYGAEKNIVVNLENDSPGAEDPFFIVKVVAQVNSPYLRALPDFGNSIRGHDAAYNQDNMSHVKDILHVSNGEVYHVDLPQLFGVARASGYKGYFSMEYDTAAGDPFEGTQNLVNQSLKYML
jgi:sugar phosphate isomerase/epimerase